MREYYVLVRLEPDDTDFPSTPEGVADMVLDTLRLNDAIGDGRVKVFTDPLTVTQGNIASLLWGGP